MEFLLRQSISTIIIKNSRSIFTSTSVFSNLSKLRRKTGYPLSSCKAALAKFNDDVDLANKWLDEQAQKEGWTKAEKLKDRKVSQGLLGLLKEKNSIAVVELNCETDFVAKNEKFEKLLSSITSSVFENYKSDKQKEILYKNDLVKVKSIENSSRTVGDDLALAIGSLGENIILRRAVFFNVPENHHIAWYIHGATDSNSKCKSSKYAALVNFKMNREECSVEPFEIGKQIAQHIVGMKPTSLGDLPNEDTKKEEEKAKPDENEKRLLYQEFLMKENSTVLEFLKEHKSEIVDFVRLECGEFIDNEPQ